MGQTQPEADRLPRICAVLGITSDELLGISKHVPVQERAAEAPVGDVDVLVRASLYRRVFTMGSIAALIGFVVLAVGLALAVFGLCKGLKHTGKAGK